MNPDTLFEQPLTGSTFTNNGKWWYPRGKPVFLLLHKQRQIPSDVEAILHRVYDNDCFVAGGFVRWLAASSLSPTPFGDIDCFGYAEDSAEKLKAALDAEPFARRAAESDWSWTYEWGTRRVNIIKKEMDVLYKTFGDPAEIVSRFDLTVTLGWLVRVNGKFSVWGDKRMVTDDMRKEIHFNLIKHPSSSIRRIAKYAAKGYTCPTKEIVQVMKVVLAYQEEIDDYLAWLRGDVQHTRTEIRSLYMGL